MSDAPFPTGWIHRPDEVARVAASLPMPRFRDAAPHLYGSGAGKTVLLYRAFKEVNQNKYISYDAQTIGDCVSQGHGHGVDLLACVQIAIGKSNEEFQQTCTEAVYGMARVDVGNQHDNQDGAVGAWAAKAISTEGTVSRNVTGPYDGRRAKLWGRVGVPADIKAQATAHKVKTVSLVQSYSELEDSLANGYPVTVCSNQGFTMTRDANGFCRPSGHWGHCMLLVGVRADDTPGACVFQSWGFDVPDGPLSLDQPPNSFWAPVSTVAAMLALEDSWALSNFDGYEGQSLPDHWSYDDLA